MSWQGELNLNYRVSDGRVLYGAEHRGPLMVQKPYHHNEYKNLHHYLLHPPGGLVGGDELKTSVKLQETTKVLLTSPSAQKVYRSDNKTAKNKLTLHLDRGSHLHWLPQETILFGSSHYSSETDVHLHKEASLIFWEIFIFGRPSIQETHCDASIDAKLRIYLDKVPIVVDRYLKRPLQTSFSPFSDLQKFTCYGQLFIVSPKVDQLSEEEWPEKSQSLSWTRYQNTLQFRYLGNSAYDARERLGDIVVKFNRLTNEYYCKPRIWAY